MPKVPCKNCKDRFVGCHSSCEKYKAFKEENEKFKAQVRRERDMFNFFMACQYKVHKR